MSLAASQCCHLSSDGPPVSRQTRSRANVRAWREKVRNAARQTLPAGQPPYAIPLKITVVFYHEGAATRMDNDNMIKPVQDALIGLVYEDDRLITDTEVRKSDIDRPYRVRWISEILS